ncbi:Crp/Fnr family transcriptional regulator [Chryseobacterium limigenitum]|uniref:cAMP-binding domain of CRP or a regulatory subunit of cAMP-dependent protein kinases n=1 Tax=Chryseobacterium limigenitum TaxID=1612149 RepID=A0A1K2IL60_9FLAO|nr:Crp/Fnr family transcriptional regulator [Chryseobacterium limigenitum]SFZ92952.1 cAMP-binding domain of CRP or a regulatory subunit of cAMP-dependent protein kinases [Chryseobacterium limigenitum]
MHELFFKNIAKHIDLEDFEKDLIKSKLHLKMVRKNDVLLESGSYCREIYFVTSGCLRIFQHHEDGTETSVLFCPENWWASDIVSFSQGQPSTFSIEALEDGVVTTINAVNLEELYRQIPKLERFFRILFQNGFALYQRRLTLALSSSAEIRYNLFSKQYPNLINRVALKHIASYLGITPVFLSIIRKK